MNSNLNHFITWSKQTNVETPNVESCDNLYFYNGDSKVLDLSSISFQMSFGLQNKVILNSITNQMNLLSCASPKAESKIKTIISKKLIDLLNIGRGKIFYTVSGAESVENALKIVRLATGKQKILARHRSYHGATYGALAVTGDWRNAPHQTGNDTIRIPEPSDDPKGEKLELIIKNNNDIAAIIIETISGGNGVIIPPDSWWKAVRVLTKKYNIKVILDEVVCGFYRTGKPFGFHHFDIEPDVVCMAKAISGGFYPMGGVFVKKEIADYFDDNILSCGLTNYAHPLGLAAIAGVFNIIEDQNNLDLMNTNIKSLSNFLLDIKSKPSVKDTRHIGMLAIVEHNQILNESSYKSKNIQIYHHPNDFILSPNLLMPNNILEDALNTLKGLL